VLALKMLVPAQHLSDFNQSHVCETNLRRIPILPSEKTRYHLMSIERRTHARSNLHIPAFLFPIGCAAPIRTETENISSDAFFCYCDYPFSPGDQIRFLLLLPDAHNPLSKANASIYLCGAAEVIRISVATDPSSCGVALRIHSYRVFPDTELLGFDRTLAAMTESNCQ
jgi:hypothetical protein